LMELSASTAAVRNVPTCRCIPECSFASSSATCGVTRTLMIMP
jgi:hypothetical protein